MHTVQLNIVKAALDRLIHDDDHPIDWEEVDRCLQEFPWTAEFRASRLPTGIKTRIGYWKAEDYSRFAYPASEVVLAGLLNDSQMQSWLCVARMEQFLLNHARNGWTEPEAQTFHQMALRYAMLVEEECGPQHCAITLHNLQHFKEDIQRFSSLDNYSCWVKERAVKRYIRRSNNHKNIEVTFAATEVRREVLRIRRNEEKRLQENKIDRPKIWAKTMNQAKMLVSKDAGIKNQSHNGILVGGLQDYHLSEDVKMRVTECVEADRQNVEESCKSCRSVWFPEHKFNGLLYRENEAIIFISHDGEIVGKIRTIFTVRISGENRAFLRLRKFCWTGNAIRSFHKTVQEDDQIVVGELKYISRKVMLQKGIDGDNKLVVIDFMRRIFPIMSGSVIVPYYPVTNDVVLVQGGEDEIWKAKVCAFNLQQKILQCRFFVKENGVWIPERGLQNQRISFESILGIADGMWLTEYSKWLEN